MSKFGIHRDDKSTTKLQKQQAKLEKQQRKINRGRLAQYRREKFASGLSLAKFCILLMLACMFVMTLHGSQQPLTFNSFLQFLRNAPVISLKDVTIGTIQTADLNGLELTGANILNALGAVLNAGWLGAVSILNVLIFVLYFLKVFTFGL